MRFIWTLIIFHFANAATNNSAPKEYLDPNDAEDKIFLWKNLFIKLNTVLAETEKLNQRLDDVNQRLDDLSKRQTDLENRLTNNMSETSEDSKKREEIQENLLTKLMDNINEIREDSKRSQQWTTILRRKDASVDFNRPWNDYKLGFGNPEASFFIGLERMHAMTSYGSPQELLVVLIDFDNQTRYAYYDLFRIGNETEKYTMKDLGNYSGDAGDGLGWHSGKHFTTFDRDNNEGKIRDCPMNFKGGWWFHDPCYIGFLNGIYREEKYSHNFGVSWDPWRRWNYSVKFAAMMIRPKI